MNYLKKLLLTVFYLKYFISIVLFFIDNNKTDFQASSTV